MSYPITEEEEFELMCEDELEIEKEIENGTTLYLLSWMNIILIFMFS